MPHDSGLWRLRPCPRVARGPGPQEVGAQPGHSGTAAGADSPPEGNFLHLSPERITSEGVREAARSGHGGTRSRALVHIGTQPTPSASPACFCQRASPHRKTRSASLRRRRDSLGSPTSRGKTL